MNNFKEFLIDNYIWIIVVIVLIIITIIGFLADKKRDKPNNGNGNQQPNPTPNQPLPTGVQPQLVAANMGQVPNNGGMQPMPNVQALATMPSGAVAMQPMAAVNQPQPVMPGMINNVTPQPVEPIVAAAPTSEPLVAPLSEQKPTFSNQSVEQNINNFHQNNPQPIVNNNINEQMVQPEPAVAPMNTGIPAAIPQPINNAIQNNMAMPQPVEPAMQVPPVVQPQPVEPMPIPTAPMPNVNPVPIPNQNMVNQAPQNIPNTTIPNTATTPQELPPQPVNFVYGPQNNNGMPQ